MKPLRSPLAIIQGGLEVIEQEINRNPDLQPMPVLAPLNRGTQRMLCLVNDMLEIHRLEEGELVLQTSRVPVRSFLEEVASQYTSVVEEVNLRLIIDAPSDLPALLVDVEHTGRVLHNLLDNAMQYTPEGGEIVITARRQEEFIEIQVQDTGSGISAEHLPYIFERFYRADQSRSRATGGAGLGLTIVKQLVEAQGGQISACSQAGQGTTISFSLPVAQENAAIAVAKTGNQKQPIDQQSIP